MKSLNYFHRRCISALPAYLRPAPSLIYVRTHNPTLWAPNISDLSPVNNSRGKINPSATHLDRARAQEGKLFFFFLQLKGPCCEC